MAVGNNVSKPVTYTDRITGRTVNIAPASQGGYMSAYDVYAQEAEATRARQEQRLNNELAQNNATTNTNFDNSARQAYVDYMRKQRALPTQLQALGVRGGATESGLLNLYNNYGVEHAANEQQRAAELASNQRARDDAYNSYYEGWKSDLNNQYQTALNNQMNEYNNEITRFSSSVAQYPSTAAGYKAYQDWINNMAASNDPLKDIKVALIRQQMATQFPDGAPTSKSSGGGGGGSRSYGGYGGYGSSSSTEATPEEKAAASNVASAILERTLKATSGLKAKSSKTNKSTSNYNYFYNPSGTYSVRYK